MPLLLHSAPHSLPHTGAAGSSSNEAGALTEWFRAHFDHLWRLARRLGVPRQHADDVVQEAFITASRRADDIEPNERRFLIAVTVKISTNQRRRSARQLDRPGAIDHELADTPDAEQLLLQKRLRELFDAALDELSTDQVAQRRPRCRHDTRSRRTITASSASAP